MMVFFGSMAAGSAVWGQVATASSVSTALLVAAGAVVLAIPVTARARLGQGEALDLAPSAHWPAPAVDADVDATPDRGPVMISITYRIDPADEVAFLQALHALSGERYRDGAWQWNVYQDAADPARWVECFVVSSWAEHLRQHDRVTRSDADLQASVKTYHRGPDAPLVTHWLAPAHRPSSA